jgi:hypothetical protein
MSGSSCRVKTERWGMPLPTTLAGVDPRGNGRCDALHFARWHSGRTLRYELPSLPREDDGLSLRRLEPLACGAEPQPRHNALAPLPGRDPSLALEFRPGDASRTCFIIAGSYYPYSHRGRQFPAVRQHTASTTCQHLRILRTPLPRPARRLKTLARADIARRSTCRKRRLP